MTTLSILFCLTPFVPSFREIGKVEILDGQPKQELKPVAAEPARELKTVSA